MRQELVTRFNSRVGPEDTTFHLGDFTMLGAGNLGKVEKIIPKLNGEHHLILGNHDRMKPFQYIEALGFTSVHTSLKLGYKWAKLVLNHDPAVYALLDKDEILLHGHIHELYKDLLPEKKVINVGVDVWDFYPVSAEEIINLINERGYKVEAKYL
jgi:calcineurin-like phosphoesterase family protein